MNIPLDRIIDGIIATMRANVVPHVTDSYARGQAVGVIDLLGNIAGRIEWAHAPLLELVDAKLELLAEIAAIVPGMRETYAGPPGDAATGEELRRLKGELDRCLADTIVLLWPRRRDRDIAPLVARIQAHLHDELLAEMKSTRKPLFSEIAKGG